MLISLFREQKSAGTGKGGNETYAEIQEKNLSKLAKAAWNGDVDKLTSALKKGDINEADSHGR